MGSQFVKVALQADVGGFVSGFSQADSAAGKFGATVSGLTHIGGAVGSAIDAMAQKATNFAKKVAAGGIAGTLFFGGLGVAAARLEAPLRNVQTLMGQDFGAKQFKEMTDQVIDLSRKVPQSATDIANGLYNIASSGFYGADATKVLNASLIAATAGLTSTQNASTAVTSALNAYGLGANHAKDISDILFQTVNLGVVTFEQLTGVIGDSVGTAAAAGVKFDQVGSAIATMTLSGISAEESGTSLNRLLQAMIDPSDSLAGAFRMLGYESGAQALKVDGLHKVMEKLRVASKGNIETLLQWFPEIRAARGALALMANEGENYNRVAAQIEDKNARAGATQRAFAIQSNSALMQFQKFVNGLKAAGLEIGQYFLPAGKAILSFATEIVDAFNNIPGPIKALIGWAGALGSALMALAGIFLAWRLKTAVMNFALETIGRGMSSLGRQVGTSGGALTTFGSRLSNIQGPFGITRAVLGSTFDLFGRFGQRVSEAGVSVQGMASKMGPASGVMGAIGRGMQRAEGATKLLSRGFGAVGNAAANLMGALPTVVAVGFAIYSAFQHAKDGAEALSDSLTKGMNKADPMSLVTHYEKVRDKLSQLTHSINNDQGDFFDQVVSTAKEFVKNVGDLGTNLVGIDVIQDSTWDQWFKADKLDETQRKIVTSLHNMSRNVTEVFNTMNPSKALKPGQLLGINTDDFLYIARAAENAGVDISKSFAKSGPERQKLMLELVKMSGFFDGLGKTSGTVSDAMIKQAAAMAKAVEKAGKGASDAFSKSFDLFKSIDPTLGDVGGQITKFYTDSLTSAQKFYDGIQTLQARGLDPTVIQKMLQAGPQAAGAVVQAAVDDTTGGVIATLNMGEAALAKFSARAAEIARLTQQAIMSDKDQKTKDLGMATQIANTMFEQGGLATTDTVAKALSMDPASVQQIADEFGITLRNAVTSQEYLPKALTSAVGPYTAAQYKLREDLQNTMGVIQQFTHVDTNQAVGVVKKLGEVLAMPEVTPQQQADKRIAIEQLMDTVNAIPNAQDKRIVFQVVNDELAKQKMRDVLENAFGPGRTNKGATGLTETQIDFLLSVRGDADAIAKVSAFADSINATPHDKAVMLRALGTDEAKQKAHEIDSAIEKLHGANLPITADNVDAILKSNNVKATIASLQGKTLPIDAGGNALSVIGQIGSALRSLDGASATVNIYGKVSQSVASAGMNILSKYGNLLKFYAGGGVENHVAQFAPAGAWRVWAEPETGGEAYIPLARDKRARSMEILKAVAAMFGKQVVGFATGDVYSTAAGQTYGQLTTTSSYYDLLKTTSSGTQAIQQAFAGAGGDFLAGIAAADSKLQEMAKTLYDVQQAAGATAAQQLAASGLTGDAWDLMAQNLIKAGEDAKQASQDAADAAQQAAEDAKQAADEAAQQAKDAAEELHQRMQDIFDAISNPVRDLENVVGAMDTATAASFRNIQDYYNQMIKGSNEFAQDIQKLAQMGLNTTTLKQLLEAGPTALNTVRAMLAGGQAGVQQINSSVTSLEQIANQLGITYSNTLVAPKAPEPGSTSSYIIPSMPVPYQPMSAPQPTVTTTVTLQSGAVQISGTGTNYASAIDFEGLISDAFSKIAINIWG